MSREIKRKQFINAAFRLFTERGYSDTRIADITEACGMGKATFYEYFSSKECIFEEVFKMHIQDAYKDLPTLLNKADTSCRSKLETFVKFEFDLALKIGNHRNFIDHLITQVSVIPNKSLQVAMRNFFTMRYDLILDIISEGIEKGEIVKADKMLAASIFLGAYHLYSSLHYGIFDESNDFAATDAAKPFGAHDFPPSMEPFFDLIFAGFEYKSSQTLCF